MQVVHVHHVGVVGALAQPAPQPRRDRPAAHRAGRGEPPDDHPVRAGLDVGEVGDDRVLRGDDHVVAVRAGGGGEGGHVGRNPAALGAVVRHHQPDPQRSVGGERGALQQVRGHDHLRTGRPCPGGTVAFAREDAGGRPLPRGGRSHSHSMVPGGLLVTSSTTRLTPSTSLVIRVDTRASTSWGTRVQSAVIASSLLTGRSTTGWP